MVSRRIFCAAVLVAALLFGFGPSAQAAKEYRFRALVPPELDMAGVESIVVLDFATEAAVQSNDAASTGTSTTFTWSRRVGEGSARSEQYGRRFALDLRESLSAEGGGSSEARSQGDAGVGRLVVLPSYQLMREFSDKEHSIEAVIEVCRARGADAIVWGDIHITGTARDWEEVDTSSDDGDETVLCSAIDVRAEVAVRVFSTEDGHILGSRIFGHSDSESGCDTSQPGSLGDLVDEALDTLVAKATRVLVPANVDREVLVVGPSKRKARRQTHRAFELAEQQSFVPALQALEEIHKSHSSEPITVYNLGVLYEMADNPDKAEEYYRQAGLLGLKHQAGQALARIENRHLELSRLANMGYAVAPKLE